MSSDGEQLQAAIAIANLDAGARFQSASVASKNAADAQTTSAKINADAQTNSANIEAAWRNSVASTETSAQTTVATTESGWRNTVASTEAQWRISVADTESKWRSDVANIETQAQTSVADTESQWRINVAGIEAGWRNSVASTESSAQTGVASIDASWHTGVANIEANAKTAVASTEASAATAVAATNLQGTIHTADQANDAAIQSAKVGASAQTDSAKTDAAARTEVANTEAAAQRQVAQTDADARRDVAQTEATASNFKATQEFNGVALHESSETARLGQKLTFANDKFDAILPLINEVVGGSSSGSGGSAGFHASITGSPIGFGGAIRASSGVHDLGDGDQVGYYSRRRSGPLGPMRMGAGDTKTGGIGFGSGGSVADATAATQLPFISTSGVLTPAQVQQQVNAAYARNDARTQSEIRKLTGDMAGRGFSASSPILAALQVGLVGQGLRASLQAATQIRLDSAKLNADAVFDAQKAVSEQFLQQEGVLIDNAKNDTARTVGILSAVAQMVGSAL